MGSKGTKVIRPKSEGSGIMISDFICEQSGYLSLTDKEYGEAKKTNSNIRKYAWQPLEYGEAREGYWTSEKFMKQIEEAMKIVEF